MRYEISSWLDLEDAIRDGGAASQDRLVFRLSDGVSVRTTIHRVYREKEVLPTEVDIEEAGRLLRAHLDGHAKLTEDL